MGVRKRERPRRPISMIPPEVRKSRAEAALKELKETKEGRKELAKRWMALNDEDALEMSDWVDEATFKRRFG